MLTFIRKSPDLTCVILHDENKSHAHAAENSFDPPLVNEYHSCLSNMQIKLVTEAIKQDEEGKLKEAAELYCEAMAFFLPAIECKSNVPCPDESVVCSFQL